MPVVIPADTGIHTFLPPVRIAEAKFLDISITCVATTRAAVTLRAIDALGREVARPVSGERAAGSYRERWTTNGLPDGLYFCELQTAIAIRRTSIILMR